MHLIRNAVATNQGTYSLYAVLLLLSLRTLQGATHFAQLIIKSARLTPALIQLGLHLCVPHQRSNKNIQKHIFAIFQQGRINRFKDQQIVRNGRVPGLQI